MQSSGGEELAVGGRNIAQERRMFVDILAEKIRGSP